MNLQIRTFKESLVNQINSSELPIEVKRMCVSEILQQLEIVSNEIVNKELLEIEKKKAEESNEEVTE